MLRIFGVFSGVWSVLGASGVVFSGLLGVLDVLGVLVFWAFWVLKC